MYINSTIIFSYIGLSQALFSAFLFYTKSDKKAHDRVLILWLLTIAFRFFLIATEQIHGQFFDAEFSIGLVPLTFGPFLYLYAKYLVRPIKKFNPNEVLHFAPFLILVSIYFVVFKDRFSIQAFALSISISTFFLITSLIYTGAVFILLRRFRKTIRPNMFSYDTTNNRLFWLNYISIIYAITYLIYFITKFYAAFAETDSKGLEIIPSVGLMILTYSVSYFAIKQPNLFKNESAFDEDEDKYRRAFSDRLSKIELPHIGEQKNNDKLSLATEKESKQSEEEIPQEKIKQLEKLALYMLDAKPFLKPELTLQDLSDQVNIPKHQITQLLNNHLGKNFFEYINEYRIEETKKRMLDENYSHLTLVAIAYECGFNSKSTFNTFFKNATGATPTEWRKTMKEKDTMIE